MTDPWALTLTVVVSMISFGASMAALAWNIISWLYGAGRPKMDLALRGPIDGGTGQLTAPTSTWPKALSDTFDGDPALIVTVRNVGRGPLTVQKIRLNFSMAGAMSSSSGLQHPLPIRSPPGAHRRVGRWTGVTSSGGRMKPVDVPSPLKWNSATAAPGEAATCFCPRTDDQARPDLLLLLRVVEERAIAVHAR